MRCRHRPGRRQGACWRRWSEATCSWSRSTTAATGIATTTSSPTCCRRICWTSSPTRSPTLHRRASAWYEQNGEPSEAIRHALAAEDFERAADLVELAMPGHAQEQAGGHAASAGSRRSPTSWSASGPCSASAYAGALLASGELEGVEARLRDAERWLDTTTGTACGDRKPQPAEMVVVDEEEFRRLPGAIAVYRAGQALARGDVAGTVTHARRALDLVAEDDHLGRGAAAALLGLASWTSGDLEAAHRSYADGMARLQRAGHISDVIGCAIALADIRIAQGRLREAMRTYEQALQLATEQGGPVLRGTADMYVGMSELHRERNDLDAATQHLLTQPGAGRAHRVAAEPVSLARRDGADTGGRGRSGRRARPARRGGAPVCE